MTGRRARMHLRSGYLTSSVGIIDGVDCGWVLWTKALTLLVRAMPTKAALACELLGGPPGASWGKAETSAGLGAVVSARDASNCSSSSERLNSLSVSDAMTAAVAVFHASFRIRTHHRPASGCVMTYGAMVVGRDETRQAAASRPPPLRHYALVERGHVVSWAVQWVPTGPRRLQTVLCLKVRLSLNMRCSLPWL